MSKRMESPTSILRAFRTTYGGESVLARMRLSALAATIYTVWNAQNRTVFDDEDHRIEDLVKKANTSILEGDPKEMICEAAEEMHADLIVVGSRGLGKIKRAFLGSVSDYVVHHAKCPVLVVKKPPDASPQ